MREKYVFVWFVVINIKVLEVQKVDILDLGKSYYLLFAFRMILQRDQKKEYDGVGDKGCSNKI